MNKAHIILTWEQDWDDPKMFYQVTESGTIQKYDVENDILFEYDIEKVAH